MFDVECSMSDSSCASTYRRAKNLLIYTNMSSSLARTQRCINRLGCLIGLVMAIGATTGHGEELPEMRPALLGTGPKALVNIIDTQALLKKGQGNAAVMFCCMLEANGNPLVAYTYRWTPGGEALEREVFRKLVEARYVPGVYKHRRVPTDLYGTVIYRVIDGRPRLRIFLNQERSELAQENDFIAPQPVTRPGMYPLGSLFHGGDGTVVLRLSVDATGKRKSVSVESETPPGHDFGKGILPIFNEYNFIPGYRNGKPVDSTTTLTVYFKSR
jgi:Gram-negative bacterial TonB protein C-terminal